MNLQQIKGINGFTTLLTVVKEKQSRYLLCFLTNRQRPTFPGSRPPSIISAKELNFCVRDGNRCDLLAIVTGYRICLFANAFECFFCTLRTE